MPTNTTLYIDNETQDLTFTPSGDLTTIHNRETTAQCVRLTLTAYKGDFFLDITHGTEWPRILGRKHADLTNDEAEEVMRSAILQETDVAFIDTLNINHENRQMNVEFEGTLRDGSPIQMNISPKI